MEQVEPTPALCQRPALYRQMPRRQLQPQPSPRQLLLPRLQLLQQAQQLLLPRLQLLQQAQPLARRPMAVSRRVARSRQQPRLTRSQRSRGPKAPRATCGGLDGSPNSHGFARSRAGRRRNGRTGLTKRLTMRTVPAALGFPPLATRMSCRRKRRAPCAVTSSWSMRTRSTPVPWRGGRTLTAPSCRRRRSWAHRRSRRQRRQWLSCHLPTWFALPSPRRSRSRR